MQIIGIDIGTTKIAGVRISGNTLEKVLSEQNNAALESSHEKIQDPARILEIAFRIIDGLKDGVARPYSIGISSQMHGFLYVDREGNACSPLFTWQDSRATAPLDGSTAQNLIKEKTGHSIFSGYAWATHYYNWRKGLQPPTAHKIVSIGSYLAMKLCHVSEACIDPSEAAGFGLYDLERQSFLLESITELWGDTDFLPRLVPFHHQVGTDKDQVPVFQSLGDNQSSFYATMQEHQQGLQNKELQNKGLQDAQLLLNLGTGGQISFQVEDLEDMTVRGMEVRPYPRGKLVVGSTLAGGKSFELLVDFFAEILSFFGTKLSKEEIYRTIKTQLAAEDWESSLVVEPYFYGTREDPERRGAIRNIGATNLETRKLIYGFAEAIVLELKDLWVSNGFGERFTLKKVVGSGNGVRRNPIICHMIEKIFQAELVISELQEEAACGAAWYAKHSRQH